MLMESFYGTDVCPNDYPYAYRNGKRCCRYIVDKNKDVLTINSTSCYADDYFDSIPCPFEICSTGIFSISYYYVKNLIGCKQKYIRKKFNYLSILQGRLEFACPTPHLKHRENVSIAWPKIITYVTLMEIRVVVVDIP